MADQGSDPQRTHESISRDLVGEVSHIQTGQSARVTLQVHPRMKADEKGLIHGGFTFSLADYAAMVAVNDPYVVLLSSQVKFLKPVMVDDLLTAQARVTGTDGRKRQVWCEIWNQNAERVLEGEFLCLVLANHILEK